MQAEKVPFERPSADAAHLERVPGGRSPVTRAMVTRDQPASPRDPRLVELPIFPDDRGVLTFGEYGDHLPFIPKRYYVIMDVPGGKTRGGHAHSRYHSFLVCLKGSCHIALDNGQKVWEYRLDSPRKGLYVPPMHFNRLSEFSSDAVLLSLSSGLYDRSEYVLAYDEFTRRVNRG
ncbi:MAG TPA: FdtA/QdtA family cupin domain-containing protein [Gemmatimonadaceae bacterium]|nr:FdtA/QdtA family cupin domain-containing protein [Gemmatimonadaceae bacterium]